MALEHPFFKLSEEELDSVKEVSLSKSNTACEVQEKELGKWEKRPSR
jgi:hypothetical protein